MPDHATEDHATEAGDLIRVMPETLANKIAAGEVVQRPASVLKELMENAVDAGASRIDVFLKRAGRDLVQVVDNGCGMSAQDARTSFRRHATSKVTSVEDLHRIKTLGFRGEALASIAAVSRVEMKTRCRPQPMGTQIRIEGGETIADEPCATPEGTSIAVRNLFYNVPARRNFLKTRATELKHLIATFHQLALAHPSIAFALSHNEHELYRLPAASSEAWFDALEERMKALFDEDARSSVVRIDDASSYLSVEGVTAAPESGRTGRTEQYLFVNGRYVSDRYLSHAVKSAYGDLLPEGVFPFFALFLTMDPERVDVNVHPTKAEVKFDDESGIYGFLKHAVQEGLRALDLTPDFREASSFDAGDGASSPAASSSSAAPSSGSSAGPPAGSPAGSSTSGVDSRSNTFSDSDVGSPSQSSSRSNASSRPSDAPLGELSDQLYGFSPDELEQGSFAHPPSSSAQGRGKLLWQLGKRYIMMENDRGLVLVDPPAAHSRILYERLLAQLKRGAGNAQQLLFPQVLELRPDTYALIEEMWDDLRAVGFDLEKYSGRSVKIRGIPVGLRSKEGALLKDLLEQYAAGADDLQSGRHKPLARTLALRGAVSEGTALSEDEMRTLLTDLSACEMPYVSPDGRPTTVKLSFEELEQRFAG